VDLNYRQRRLQYAAMSIANINVIRNVFLSYISGVKSHLSSNVDL